VQSPVAGRQQGAAPSGVVDTLTAGYAAVNRQLWILLIPILVDCFLWLGPQVSYSTVIDPLILRGSQWAQHVVVSAPTPADQSQQTLGRIDQIRQDLLTSTPETNALGLMIHSPLALPSISPLLDARGPLSFIRNSVDAVSLAVLMLLAGMGLGGYFRAALAQQVATGRANPLSPALAAPGDIARAVGYLLVLLGLAVLLGLPLLLLLGFVAIVAAPVALIGTIFLFVGAVAVVLYLYFGLDAVFVSGASPLQAIQCSVSVTRRHLGPTTSFVLLSLLIGSGMSVVWGLTVLRLSDPYGPALAILGNAYIASGLAAASMIFYRERVDASVLTSQPVRRPRTA
jgi:hypothetical protein